MTDSVYAHLAPLILREISPGIFLWNLLRGNILSVAEAAEAEVENPRVKGLFHPAHLRVQIGSRSGSYEEKSELGAFDHSKIALECTLLISNASWKTEWKYAKDTGLKVSSHGFQSKVGPFLAVLLGKSFKFSTLSLSFGK